MKPQHSESPGRTVAEIQTCNAESKTWCNKCHQLLMLQHHTLAAQAPKSTHSLPSEMQRGYLKMGRSMPHWHFHGEHQLFNHMDTLSIFIPRFPKNFKFNPSRATSEKKPCRHVTRFSRRLWWAGWAAGVPWRIFIIKDSPWSLNIYRQCIINIYHRNIEIWKISVYIYIHTI